MSEVRLIDANALRTRVSNVPMHGNSSPFYAVMSELVHVVDTAPTVDAEPVRHGRWITRNNGDKTTRIGDYEEWLECSLCLGETDVWYPGCPWCRAKMDAREEA